MKILHESTKYESTTNKLDTTARHKYLNIVLSPQCDVVSQDRTNNLIDKIRAMHGPGVELQTKSKMILLYNYFCVCVLFSKR